MAKITEPSLETIEDYDTLKGDKKKVVTWVIVTGLIIGALYVLASDIFTNNADYIPVQDPIKTIPMK